MVVHCDHSCNGSDVFVTATKLPTFSDTFFILFTSKLFCLISNNYYDLLLLSSLCTPFFFNCDLIFCTYVCVVADTFVVLSRKHADLGAVIEELNRYRL